MKEEPEIIDYDAALSGEDFALVGLSIEWNPYNKLTHPLEWMSWNWGFENMGKP